MRTIYYDTADNTTQPTIRHSRQRVQARRAVRNRAIARILGGRHMECAYCFGGRHMECAYYFDFRRLRLLHNKQMNA